MILSMVKIAPHSDKRKEVIEILLSMKGPTLVATGCLECTIARADDDESRRILYIEQWRSWEDLRNHIRSRIYLRLLEALELSRETPEVRFFEISAMKGMELIETERGTEPPPDFLR